MPRYTVRLSDCENGVRVERTVSMDAKSPSGARKMALALYGSEVAVVSVHPERYFEHRQHRFCWTAERQSDGTFSAVEYAPIGPGARTGKATRWKPTREAHFRTRAAAKDCARQWYDAAKAKDTGSKAAEEQERQVPPELRVAYALIDPSLGTCRNCGGQLHVTRGQSGERFAVCSGEDDEEPQWASMEARLTRGCGQTFPLPQRSNLGPSGRTCTCGWPLIEVVPPYIDSRPWLQCIDTNCTNLRDEWHGPEG